MEKASWKNGLVGVNIYPLFFSCDLSRFPCFSPSLLVYSALIDTVLSIPLCVNGSLLPDGFWPHSAIVVAALPSFLLFLFSYFSHNPPLSPLSPSFSTNLSGQLFAVKQSKIWRLWAQEPISLQPSRVCSVTLQTEDTHTVHTGM